MICDLCPRRCAHERDGSTFCGVGETPRVARAALHMWEEPCISGERGSGTVFFSGCSLGCVYCQNREISLGRFGKDVTEDELRAIYGRLISEGAHNINLVTGSHFIPAIARSLRPKLPVPVVFNCGGYESVESLRLLEGLVDVYLPDMKYMDGEAARKYSLAANYPAAAQTAMEEMYRQVGDCRYDESGMLLSGMCVRHLILPDNVRNSLMVIDWFKEFSAGRGVLFSLMSQFTPAGGSDKYPELGRRITAEEFDAVKLWLYSAGIENGFIQQPDSADEGFVPAFDLTGV